MGSDCYRPIAVIDDPVLNRLMGRIGFQTIAAFLAVLCNLECASACTVVIPREWGAPEFRKMAKDAVNNSTVIIDGEVVQPFIEGKQDAVVRAVRILKGPEQTLFEVGARDSCSLRLDRPGERRRMLLVGGPTVYDLWNDGSNARYEDHVLRSDRRKVWPFVAGHEPSPAAAR
jgi:hypothetical protein